LATDVLTTDEPDVDGREVTQAGEVRNRRVESMRAAAALAVLLTHAYAFTHLTSDFSSVGAHLALGAAWGVYVFFALTGYLIFLPFARRWWGSGAPISYRKYGANRALRILPIYYVVLLIYTAWHRDSGSWSVFPRFLVFWQNYSTHSIYRIDGPMWSLVDEVQFYLLLPLVAALLALVSRRNRVGALTGLVVLGLASGGARLWYWLATSDPSVLVQFHEQHWYLWVVSLPLVFVFFVPGMLLALMRVAWEVRRPRWVVGITGRGEAWFVAGVIVFLVGCTSSYLQVGDLIALIGSFLIVGAVVLPFATVPRLGFLDWRPIALIGLASYSVYLLHQPIVEAIAGASWYPNGFAAVLAGSAVAVCCLAGIGYAVIERPFLRLRRGWSIGRAAR
jgi:peptidoglycan/LPS O-acetylase OafA/YrhL